MAKKYHPPRFAVSSDVLLGKTKLLSQVLYKILRILHSVH